MRAIAVKVIAFAGLPIALVLSLLLGLSVLGTTSSPAVAAPADVCFTTGPLRGVDLSAANNARIVVAVAERAAGSAGAVIAVMTAFTESHLLVLGNTNVAGGGTTVQGMGSDHDSVGLFQQRGSWGSLVQRLDPAASTRMFVNRLTTLAQWRTESPWVAAQKVQVSAWDGHPRRANHFSSVFGGNYEPNLSIAQSLVDQIEADVARSACGALAGGLPANGAAGSHGLPDAYAIPASATPNERAVVAYAIAQLDKPYVFGAAGPQSFDCSGLTMAAWAEVGIQLPHDANAQSHSGQPTSADALVPGDLVFVPGDDGTLAAPGHVGLYIGSGLVLNAADERDGIRVQTYDNFLAVGHGLAALRHIA